MSGIGLLILAAGASTRLGHPKQLLPYQGKPLIQQMADVAIAAGCQPVGVVLGAAADRIEPHVAHLNLHLIRNPHWPTGMASSIQCGLRELLIHAPDLAAIVLMVCDQPLISAPLIQQLIASYHHSKQPIVAAEYAGILGVPALFDKAFFPALAALQGDRGARPLIRQHRDQCLGIPFAEGAIDLDTPQDVERFSQPPI